MSLHSRVRVQHIKSQQLKNKQLLFYAGSLESFTQSLPSFGGATLSALSFIRASFQHNTATAPRYLADAIRVCTSLYKFAYRRTFISFSSFASPSGATTLLFCSAIALHQIKVAPSGFASLLSLCSAPLRYASLSV